MRKQLIGLWLLLCASPALANEPLLSLSLRERYESRANYDFSDAASDNDQRVHSRLRLGLRYGDKDGDFAAYGEALHAGVWGSAAQDDSFSIYERLSEPSEAALQVQQAYIDIGELLDEHDGALLRIGRQEIEFESGRMLTSSDWDNLPKSYDALRFQARYAPLLLDALAIELDLERELFAGALALDFRHTRLSISDIFLRDPKGEKAREESNTLGAWFKGQYLYAGVLDRGMVDIELEGQFQSGTLQGDCPAIEYSRPIDGANALPCGEEAKRDASFVFGSIGFTYPAESQPSLAFSYGNASGDDATSEDIETFDPLFGESHKSLGAADLLAWKNAESMKLRFGVEPIRELALELSYLNSNLDDTSDYWYIADGQPQDRLRFDANNASNKSDLWQEIDFAGTYRHGDKLQIGVGVAYILPGSYIEDAIDALGEKTSDAYFIHSSAQLDF